MQKRSRLNRTSEQKTKKQIIILTISIIVIIILLIQIGPIILNASGSVISSFQKTTQEQTTDDTNLESPFIVSIPIATNSATITITGSAPYSDAEVELFVNNKNYDSAILTDEQKFSFTQVRLTEGDNVIKARVKKGTNTSGFTREYTVVYAKNDPTLEISHPNENQEFSSGDQQITVQGKTDPENSITVNSFRAIVDGDGNFSYYLRLQDGDNQIKIDATSPAGKTITKEVKVIYKP